MSQISGGSGIITAESGDANQVAFFNGATTLDGVAELTWTDGTKTLLVNGTLLMAAGTAAAPSIAVNGDTNNGLFFPAADTVAVSTAGVEAWRTLSTGEFLVGVTATPGDKLIYARKDQNAATSIGVTNTNAGAASRALFRLLSDTADATLEILSSGFASNPNFVTLGASHTLRLDSGGTNPTVVSVSGTEKARFASTGELLVNTVTNASGAMIVAQKNQNAATHIRVINTTSDTAAIADVRIQGGTSAASVGHTSALYTPGLGLNANEAFFQSDSSSASLVIRTVSAAQPIRIVTESGEAARFLDNTGGGRALIIAAEARIGTEKLRVNGDIFSDQNLLWRSGTGFTGTFDHAITATRTWTFPDLAGTVALTANDLSVFAATTSAQLAGVISDETGSGLLVFGTAPAISAPTLSGTVIGTYTLGGTPTFGVDITLSDGVDFALGSTAGTKIGTAITQKLGFFNSTPVIQQTGWAPTNVVTDRVFDANATTVDELADALGTLIADLKSLGLIGA